MAGLLIILSLLFFLLPIFLLVMVLNIRQSNRKLEERIARLEVKLEGKSSKSTAEKQSVQTRNQKAISKISEPKVGAFKPTPEDMQNAKPARASARVVSVPQVSKDTRIRTERPQHYVFTRENTARLQAFLQEYWLYVLGALTLALSGIYLLRWGIDNGLIPPIMRVLASALLGASLIYFAERLRGRWGDEKGSVMEYLPSSIAAAGVSILYASTFGAYSLYGLIGVSTAFAGLGVVAILAIIAGLRFGLLLSALGIFGAYLSPFIIGGQGQAEYWLYAYSLLIMLVALIVDSFRRSAWLSVLAMSMSLCFSIFIYLHAAHIFAYDLGLVLYGFGFLLAGVIVPERSLIPKMEGASMLNWLSKAKETGSPEFPTRVAAMAMLGAVATALIAYLFSWQNFFWMNSWYFFAVTLLAFVWLGRAKALQDLPLLPMLASVAMLLVFHPEMLINAPDQRLRFFVIVLMAMILGLMSALASFLFQKHRELYGMVSVLYPLAVAFILQFLWSHLPLEAYSAGLGGLLLSEAMLIAYIFYARHGRDALLTEMAVIGCFIHASLFGFRLLSMDQWAILNLGLMGLGLQIAQQASWRYMGWVSRILTVLVASMAIGKIYWIFSGEVSILAIWMPIAVFVGFYFALRFVRDIDDKDISWRYSVQYEGFLLAIGPAIIITLANSMADYFNIRVVYLRQSWAALIFIAMGLGMKRRLLADDRLKPVRKIAMIVYFLMALALSFFSIIVNNPIFGARVVGWPIFNTLLLSYLPLCGVVYYFWKYVDFPDKEKWRLDWVFYVMMAALILELNRHLWQGEHMGWWLDNSMGETVSYTVIFLLGAVYAMYRTLRDRSKTWRNIALACLIVTMVKVYFIDLTQTAGIVRVLVLFVFGAILLSFNFLNRNLFSEELAQKRK